MPRPKHRHARRPASRTGRRPHAGRWEVLAAHASEQPLGDGVVTATLEEVLEAMAAQPPDLPWSSMSAHVLPLIPRVRPYPNGMGDGVRTMTPPGITVGCAITNVHARAAKVDPALIHDGGREGIRTQWLQTGRSIGSVLVRAPTGLRRLFGSEPRRFITPMRDLIIGFPLRADLDLVRWHYTEIASLNPSCLGPMSYVLRDGRVIPEPLDGPNQDLRPRLA